MKEETNKTAEEINKINEYACKCKEPHDVKGSGYCIVCDKPTPLPTPPKTIEPCENTDGFYFPPKQ